MKFLTTAFSFNGRLNRVDYLISIIVSTISFLVILFVAAVLAEGFIPRENKGVALIPMAIWGIGLKWTWLAALAKRFHDIGWSGASCLLAFIPFVGVLVYLVMLFVPGTTDTNTYGALASLFSRKGP